MKTPLIRGRSIAVVGYQRVKFEYIILTLGHLASFLETKRLHVGVALFGGGFRHSLTHVFGIRMHCFPSGAVFSASRG